MYIRFYLPYETVNIRLAKGITCCPGIIATGNLRGLFPILKRFWNFSGYCNGLIIFLLLSNLHSYSNI